MMRRVGAHVFPHRGAYFLAPFAPHDLVAIGLGSPPANVLEYVDDDGLRQLHRAAEAAAADETDWPAEVERAAVAVRDAFGGGADVIWRPGRRGEATRWALQPAAWGLDVLADWLSPWMHYTGTDKAAAAAINALGDARARLLRQGTLNGSAWTAALRALARVPVVVRFTAAAPAMPRPAADAPQGLRVVQ